MIKTSETYTHNTTVCPQHNVIRTNTIPLPWLQVFMLWDINYAPKQTPSLLYYVDCWCVSIICIIANAYVRLYPINVYPLIYTCLFRFGMLLRLCKYYLIDHKYIPNIFEHNNKQFTIIYTKPFYWLQYRIAP